MNLLLLGPLPPPLGGTTVLFKQLVQDISGRADIGVRVIDTSRKAAKPLRDLWRGTICTTRLVLELPRASVVAFHTSRGGAGKFGPILQALCRMAGKPLVVRIFGGDVHEWHRHASTPARRLFEVTIRHSAHVLLESKAAVAYFRTRGFDTVSWYPNSRPAAGPPPSRARPPGSGPRFVFVGHVNRAKGVFDLIEAARTMVEPVSVDVFGPLCDGMSVGDFVGSTVKYRGVLMPECVLPALADYDVLVLPSHRPQEGYPGVILEAYSAGLAVIATRVGGIPEIVTDASGLLVDKQAPQQLAAAMLTLARAPERLARLKQGAAALAEQFAAEHWSREFVSICNRVTSRR